MPKEEDFSIPQFDKLVHVGLFGILVWLWCLYYRKNSIPGRKMASAFFYIFLASTLYGVLLEIVQKYFIPMRDFDKMDIIADMMGAAVGYGICNIRLLFN